MKRCAPITILKRIYWWRVLAIPGCWSGGNSVPGGQITIWISPQAETGADAFAGAGAAAGVVVPEPDAVALMFAASGPAASAAALTFLPMPRILSWESSNP